MDEIKAILRKLTVAVEQRVIATVEENLLVQGQVADSVERAIKDASNDVKDTLDKVATAMEETTDVAEKTLGEIALVPEVWRKTPSLL